MSIGKRADLPKTTLYGTHLVALLILVLRANTSSGRNDLHLDCYALRCSRTDLDISFTLRIFLSANPFPCEWYADDRPFSMPKMLHISLITSPSTLEPWSLSMKYGVPW